MWLRTRCDQLTRRESRESVYSAMIKTDQVAQLMQGLVDDLDVLRETLVKLLQGHSDIFKLDV